MHDTTLVDIPFSLSVLLPARLAPAIVSDVEYQEACEFGYLECFSIPASCSSWVELRDVIARDVLFVHDEHKTPLVVCAGVVLGYLSAFALINRALALRGVELLEVLINSYNASSAASLGGVAC